MLSHTAILPAIRDTILGRLTPLFLSGANGDMEMAREAATFMLASYDPQTEIELCLAANIISFNLHALEALSQAATPDMPMNNILRLRSGAVSLGRVASNAESRFEQRQVAREDGTQEAPPEPKPTATPQADKAIALIEATRPLIQTASKSQPPIWSKAYHQQRAARRITENLKKNQAAHQAAINGPTTNPTA